MKTNLLAVLLTSGTLLGGCQSNTSSTDSERTSAVPVDSTTHAAVAADTVVTIGSPRLLHTLDEAHNTPDGMALAPNGNIILSVPNLANNSYPAVLMEVTDTSLQPYLTTLPPEPTTNKAAPMDLAFGPDGNLYYAENQYENDKNFKSRLMRVRVENGKPGPVETVVDNFALANAVVWKGNKIYVTDSQWDMPNDDKGSAVLVFTLDELNKGVVHLKPKTKDPHVLATFTTKVNETGVDNGADGLDYDSRGNLYTGSFGDGTMYKMTLNPDGTLAKKETMQLKGEKVSCVDGLIIDRATDKLYLCNSRENAIQVINLKNNSVTTLAKNGDTDGAKGLLDQPAEVLLIGKRLYVTNFDKPEKNFVNSKSDAPHTMSVIDLE
ncbi:SMP-30/gluconolactonase/LRE family protein [Hymenobacter sp. HD11105]